MKHIQLFEQFLNKGCKTKENDDISLLNKLEESSKIVISKADMAKLHKDGKIVIDDNEIQFIDEGKHNKTANQMLTDTYHQALEEAKAYEADDNKDHTIEEYLNEMASLTAEKMYEMYESSCNEMREELTQEMYESACNEMKESYANKMDKMLKEYKK